MARLRETRANRTITTRPIPPAKEKPAILPVKKKPMPPAKAKPIPPSEEDGREGARKRYRPGSKALSEIRRYQRGTAFLIPAASFERLVRQVMSALSVKVTRYISFGRSGDGFNSIVISKG